jgi:glucose/arabinose dehydrogenase
MPFATTERLESRRLLAAQPNLPPAAPTIREPDAEGAVINGADVHMVTAPFSDPNPGDVHRSTDWEIRLASTNRLVWRARRLTTDTGKVHVHFGDGRFVGALRRKTELPPDTDVVLRVRHRDFSRKSQSYSAWSIRHFHTAGAIVPLPGAPDWTVDQPNYKVERLPVQFPTGEGAFRLPVNIAFVPQALHGPHPGDPLFYVTELYGNVRVVSNDYTVRTYAANLLNYDATGDFPGDGEQGLAGLAVDPASGDLFVSMLYDDNPADSIANRFPKVERLHSTDGGRTAAAVTDVRAMPGEQQGTSHQVSNVSIGPDGKLYVHNGDGLATPETALDLDSFRGKILRMELDGTPAADNPFYDPADGVSARDYVYAYGLRNPFGGTWRASDAQHYEVENGTHVDRLAKVRRGVGYGWDGTDATMSTNAIYNWDPAVAPVNIAFVDPATFGGSGFPADKFDYAFVTESGSTYAAGPQARGKRISEFVIGSDTDNGSLVSGPVSLVHYTGDGRATAVALAAGPDGLYFSDLYQDDPAGGADPTSAGANILRIVYAGDPAPASAVVATPAVVATLPVVAPSATVRRRHSSWVGQILRGPDNAMTPRNRPH